MIGYIIEPLSLNIEKTISFTEYNLPLDGLPSSSGTVTLPEKIMADYSNYIFMIDGIEDLFVINEYSISNTNTTSLSISPLMKAICEFAGKISMYDGFTPGPLVDTHILEDGISEIICSANMNSIGYESYIQSKSKYLPLARTLASINGRNLMDIYQNGRSDLYSNFLENTNTNISSHIDEIKLESVAKDSGIIHYILDPIKFAEYTIYNGIRFQAKLQNHSYFLHENPLAEEGDGIIYGDRKYRVVGTPTQFGDLAIEEDNTVDNIKLIAYDAPYLFDNRILKFHKYSLNWIEPTKIRLGETSVLRSAILVNLEKTELTPKIIYFNDGIAEIKSASFDNDVVTCVTVHVISTKTSVWNSTIFSYYLKSDLTVTSIKSEQLQGKNVSLSYKTSKTYENMDWNDSLQLAVDEFAKNTYKHKVEFYSKEKMYCGQMVKLIFDDKILDTQITSISLSSSDNRYLYTCGEGSNTASEKIKSNSWKYGRRLPLAPYKGQLVFM